MRWPSLRSANVGWKASARRKPVRICVPVCMTRSSCRTSFQLRSARSAGRLVATVGLVVAGIRVAGGGHVLILARRAARWARTRPRGATPVLSVLG